MRIEQKYFIATTFVFFFISCSKKPDAGDKTAPLINIISPANNQHFIPGQTILTVANASDDNEVTELHIHVTDKTTGTLLRDIHSYPDQPSGTVRDSFPAVSGVTYTIQIIAKDPARNLATAKVDVLSN